MILANTESISVFMLFVLIVSCFVVANIVDEQGILKSNRHINICESCKAPSSLSGSITDTHDIEIQHKLCPNCCQDTATCKCNNK